MRRTFPYWCTFAVMYLIFDIDPIVLNLHMFLYKAVITHKVPKKIQINNLSFKIIPNMVNINTKIHLWLMKMYNWSNPRCVTFWRVYIIVGIQIKVHFAQISKIDFPADELSTAGCLLRRSNLRKLITFSSHWRNSTKCNVDLENACIWRFGLTTSHRN